jgi:hypothetical protein
MASYLLYIVTGAVLAWMAASHLVVIFHNSPKTADHRSSHLSFQQIVESRALHWAEAAVCGAIFLFGLWVMFTAGLIFIANFLRSF